MTRDFIKTTLQNFIYFDNFELHSGVESNYYIDCRPVFLDVRTAHYASFLLLSALFPGVNVIAGVETSGCIVVSSMVAACPAGCKEGLGGLIIRPFVKKYGLVRSVEGPIICPSSKVAIVDDVITSGSTMRFAERAIKEKYPHVSIVQFLALVDRSNGQAALSAPLTKIFTFDELLEGAKIGGKIL